ncbi:MAG: hypothetical protein FWE89_02795, partial [Syntrophaceae bacterium]|nr:hypothetical protein [Syntrophaceae bacterium]
MCRAKPCMLQVNEKYYVADHGMRQAVYGYKECDIELILENIVYLELLRRGYKITIGRVAEKEVDFLAERDNKRVYMQVVYLLASEGTIECEFDVYCGIPDNYPKYVVPMDEVDMSR